MSNPSCVVVDYGIGNVFSVTRALESLGAQVELTSDKARIKAADRVILPGVGAFGRAMEVLRHMGLDDCIREFIATQRPFLGICVGMQVLMEEGLEFGRHQGFGFFSGSVEKIEVNDTDGQAMRVPLIGWNTLRPAGPTRWQGTPFGNENLRNDVYFVHSFAARATNPDDVAAYVDVGTGQVVAALQRDNILGVQFHPERSANSGLRFLQGFLAQ